MKQSYKALILGWLKINVRYVMTKPRRRYLHGNCAFDMNAFAGPEEKDGESHDQQKAGKASRLISFPFMRRAPHSFPQKATPRILLLQGPVGPFFRRTQDHLNANGFDAWRVCFNTGDRIFSSPDKTLNFSGSLDSWRGWITELLKQNGFDTVVLFGTERVIHRIAVECCDALCIPVLCLEEGYIRPGYITMEFGGNNWRSPIASCLPPEEFSIPRKDAPKGVSCPSSFGAMAWNAFLYFTVRGLFSSLGERRLFHKQKRTLIFEGVYWVKNYYRKFAHLGKNYKISERLLEHYDGKFFIVPLQVHDDGQLGRAANSWNNQKLILKSIVSFARNAPKSHHLVFKVHPMERGHTNDRHLIRQVSALNDVMERVHILDGCSLGLLTRHSAGMITINSTSGLSAVHHGVPLAVMGRALYRHPALAFCVEKGMDLDRFWTYDKVAPEQQRQTYLSWIMHECLAGGDFYAREGIEAATIAIEQKLKTALAEPNLKPETAAQILPVNFISEKSDNAKIINTPPLGGKTRITKRARF